MTCNVKPCPWYMDFDKGLISLTSSTECKLEPSTQTPTQYCFMDPGKQLTTVNTYQYLEKETE
jgi:hypothetical protein